MGTFTVTALNDPYYGQQILPFFAANVSTVHDELQDDTVRITTDKTQ